MPDAQFDLVENYDSAPESDWFHACREAGKPYVVVRTGEMMADVMWDYVTLPPSCDDILMANARLLREQAIAIFEKHASVESSVRAKATMVFFHNLTIPKAKRAANELYGLIESLVDNPAQSCDSNSRCQDEPVAAPESKKERPLAQSRARGKRSDMGGRFELCATG